MFNYIKELNSIKEFQTQSFAKYSLSPRDYRVLYRKNQNVKILKDLLDKNKEYQGKSITSEAYTHFASPYRFIKTGNINSSFLLDETSIDYMIPYEGKGAYPKYNDVLIAKDGNGDGLGEACIYRKENKNNTDMISNEVHALKIKKDYLYYVFAFLKSAYFKSFFDLNTAQGSTMRHGKKISLNFPVPFPTLKNYKAPDKVIQYLSMIVQNIIDKEEQINKKSELINKKIEEELYNNQKSSKFIFAYPRISEIETEDSLSTGKYTPRFKELQHYIENYRNGFFSIPSDKIKSGSTPQIRIVNPQNGKYKWITPTIIKDYGIYDKLETINMPSKNNITKSCILMVNRTSKGGLGEYVGITSFYDINEFGKGQHNQGLYRIDDYSKDDLLFLLTFLNSRIMRKICAGFSKGAKMKEMKSDDFSKLHFPQFPQNIKQSIVELYYNDISRDASVTLYSYLDKEFNRNKSLGIFQLNMEIFNLRNQLEDLVDKIVNEEKINLDNFLID